MALFILFIGGILFGFREILFPFLVGGIIAYILGPLVEKSVDRGAPRAVAVFGILTFTFSSAAFFLYSFFPQFSEEGQAGLVRIQQFLDEAPELYEVFEGELQGWVEGAPEDLSIREDKVAISPPASPDVLLDSIAREDTLRDKAQVLVEPFDDGSFGISLQESSFCLLYTSPSPRDGLLSRMPSSA